MKRNELGKSKLAGLFMAMEEHLSDEQIQAKLDNSMDEEERLRIESHLEECCICEERLNFMSEVIKEAEEVTPEEIEPYCNAIERALGTISGEVTESVLEALGRNGPALVDVLEDGSRPGPVRADAAAELGVCGGPKALVSLGRMAASVGEQEEIVRKAALASLEHLSGRYEAFTSRMRDKLETAPARLESAASWLIMQLGLALAPATGGFQAAGALHACEVEASDGSGVKAEPKVKSCISDDGRLRWRIERCPQPGRPAYLDEFRFSVETNDATLEGAKVWLVAASKELDRLFDKTVKLRFIEEGLYGGYDTLGFQKDLCLSADDDICIFLLGK